jgi:zinc transport system permease protein
VESVVLERIFLFRDALLGALLIAVTCSILGVYIVLRRIVFVGAALAQISSAGVAFALWLSGIAWAHQLGAHPTALAVAITLAGVLFLGLEAERAVVPKDAAIGIAYAMAGALGILFIAKATVGEAHDIFLQGSILGITPGDVGVLLAAAVPVLILQLGFSRQILYTSFDPETARTLGYRVRFWDLAFYLALGLAVAAAMQFAGVLLVFSYLVLPPVTALLLARTMPAAIGLSVAAGLLATVVGFALSVTYDLPTAPAIAACGGGLAIVVWGARVSVARRG